MDAKTIIKNKKGMVFTVGPDARIGDAAKLLFQYKIGCLPVMGKGAKLHGILSERDIVRGMCQNNEKCLDMEVKDLMTANVVTVTPEETTQKILELMKKHNIRHLPVIEDNEPVGIISSGDVVDLCLEK